MDRRLSAAIVHSGLATIAFVMVGGSALAREIGPEANLCAEIRGLRPGEELMLRPGEYQGPCSIRRGGTPGRPLVIRAQVYRNAGGTLDFVYQFSNDANSATALGRLSGFFFGCDSGACPAGSFTTDLFFDDTDPSLLPTPITAGLLPTDGTRGQCPTCLVAAFDFIDTPSKVLAGQTSPILLVRTDARFFTSGGVSIIDGGAVNGVAFQPTQVPEPASLLLIGAGLAGLSLIRRRRKSS